MSLFVPKKKESAQGRAMVNGELVEKPRTVSTSGFKPIAKPGKPAAEPRVSIKDRMASMSMEPMETKSDSWNTPVDIDAVRKEIKTPTTFLPELKDTHKRQTYALPKYVPPPNAKEIEDLFKDLSIDEVPEVKSEDDCKVKGLTVELLPHQVAGLRFLRRSEKKEVSGGFLCDDMGLGKTVQSIALILKNKPKKDHTGPRTTLVVAPLAVMDQWAEEINSKAPGLSVDTHQGPKRASDPKNLVKHNVIVTTYDTVVSEHKRYQEKKPAPLFDEAWYRIIADEAHTFRNKSTKLADAMAALKSNGRRWALTGTPINNSINDLFSPIRFIGLSPFDDWTYWSKKTEDSTGKKVIKKVFQEYMLRREQKVITLPKCTRMVQKFKLSEHERVLIKKLLYSKSGEMLENHLLTQLLRIRQICDDPALVEGADKPESNIKEEPDEEAKKESKKDSKKDSKEPKESKEDLEETAANVLDPDVNASDDDTDDLAALLGDVTISDKSSKTSSKTKEIMKIVNKDRKRKTVIFSSFVSMLDRLAERLREEGIGYKIYQGSLTADKRRTVLHDFRTNSETSVLLCSLACAAVGINITAASRVIMVEPWWNPMVVDQAVNRVHRIGQKSPVEVYEMMAIDSIEERIFDLQDRKRAAATHMLEEDKALKDGDIRFLLYGDAKNN